MKNHLHLSFALMALFLALGHTAKADDFGYCTNTTDRSNIFRVGSTEKQGLAIRLPKEKLAMFSGCQLSRISLTTGSKRMTGGSITLFIADELDGTPLYSEAVDVSAATKWLSFSLKQPYTVTGNEECLYIGYTGEISTSSSMLMADFTADSQGQSFVYKDGQWVDMQGMGYGNASIRVGIDNAPQITDITLKPLDANGYYKAGQDCALNAQLFNFGNQTVNSFTLDVNGSQTAFTGLGIKPGETYDLALSASHTDTDGPLPLSISLADVNGQDDADPTDNLFNSTLYIYPADMERNILVEGFTGQSCSNCPAGHAIVNQFMQASATPCIEIMHHSGYQPDYFTTDADLDYTYFYGSAQTYAPAVMLNRTAVVDNLPVMNTTAANLQTVANVIERTQPYVSLSLASTFDPETRDVSVTLNILTHNDIPSATPVYNLLLVQNNLVSRQAMGGDYFVHNAVLRRVLTGNSWGVTLKGNAAKAGGRYTWQGTFTLPESILSDAETGIAAELRTWPVVPEDMRLIAYVAAYGPTVADHQVYNSVEVPLGTSYHQAGYLSDVDAPTAATPATRLYRLNGTAVTGNSRLPRGLYIQNGRKIVVTN